MDKILQIKSDLYELDEAIRRVNEDIRNYKYAYPDAQVYRDGELQELFFHEEYLIGEECKLKEELAALMKITEEQLEAELLAEPVHNWLS